MGCGGAVSMIFQAYKGQPFQIETPAERASGSTKSVPFVQLWTAIEEFERYSLRELTPTKPEVQLGAEGNCTPGLCPKAKCLHNLSSGWMQGHKRLRLMCQGAVKTWCESCLCIGAFRTWNAACMS